MTTLRDLMTQVRSYLGVDIYTTTVAELTDDVASDALSIPVSDTTELDVGVYEIDFERIRVKSTDPGQLNLWSFGRGYEGTVATGHTAGSMVEFDPLVPAATILRAINSVISQAYPRLYGVSNFLATYSRATPLLLPPGATGVIGVSAADEELLDLEDAEAVQNADWRIVPVWRWEPDMHKRLFAGLRDGTPVRVSYARRPGEFDPAAPSLDADFVDATFLLEQHADLVALGVAARLAPNYDFARLLHVGTEHRNDPQAKPAGMGVDLARVLWGLYEARIAQESMAMAREHKIRRHSEQGGGF